MIGTPELERKYCVITDQLALGSDATISGYASLFGQTDQGGDVVMKGAYEASLKRLKTQRGQEAATLIEAGAIDGLSIGYRTIKADRNAKGHRQLAELELWEVSLVTFPMLPEARIGTAPEAGKSDLPDPELAQNLAGVLRTLRCSLAE